MDTVKYYNPSAVQKTMFVPASQENLFKDALNGMGYLKVVVVMPEESFADSVGWPCTDSMAYVKDGDTYREVHSKEPMRVYPNLSKLAEAFGRSDRGYGDGLELILLSISANGCTCGCSDMEALCDAVSGSNDEGSSDEGAEEVRRTVLSCL